MPYLRPYRVAETTTSTGTGSITLAGAVTGYATFAADLANADTATIVIEAIDGSGAPTGEWEICDTTFTSPSTLSRGTLRDSSTGSRINFAAGTKRVFAISPLNTTNVQIFSAVGTSTWTKPVGAQVVRVIAISGGGGGGSGRKGAAGSNRTGGSGGNGGHYSDQVFEASALTDTVTVTVGGGGAGGASVTANSTSGNDGTDGGNTTFGGYVYVKGGRPGRGGISGTFLNQLNSLPSLFGVGNTGGTSATNEGAASGFGQNGPGAPGGGGGGGINTSNVVALGGQGLNTTNSTGPFWVNGTQASNFSGVVSGNGSAGTDLTTAKWLPGESGDGGGASHTANAGNGGKGGKWGGGGGGGGASTDSVGNSGAGGAGGDGLCVIVTYF